MCMKSLLIYRPHIISLCFLKKNGFLGIKKAYKYAKKALPNTYPKKSKMLNIYSVCKCVCIRKKVLHKVLHPNDIDEGITYVKTK